MTLFFAEIAPVERTLQWSRAGLDPALFYDPKTQKIEELIGKGVALGADDRYIFRENTIYNLSLGQIILIGTDGIRETRNPAGEMFGSDRLATLLRQNASLPSKQIINSIFEAVLAFRDGETQEDDLTLVVLKVSD